MSKKSGLDIASLLDPTPKEFVPEEDDWEKPRVEENITNDDKTPGIENSLHLRADISLTHGKYKGVPSARKNFELEEDEEAESGDEEEGVSSSEDYESEENDNIGSFQNSIFEEAEKLESLAKIEKQSKEKGIQLVGNFEKEKEKAKHTQNQQKIWESILKLRIKQQRIFTSSNRLPQKQMMQYFELKNEKIREIKKELSNSVQEYLNTMLILGYEIRAQNSASFSYIPESLQSMFEAPDSKVSRKRKRDFFTCKDDAPVDFYWDLIKEFNSSPSAYITEILDFWQKKTQLSTKITQTKFKAINQSIPTQVENAMANPEKILSKSQVLRSTSAKVLGKPDNVETDGKNDPQTERDPEIFDDSVFYQQLLKSLLEQNNTVVDSTEQTRSWLQSRDTTKKHKKNYNSKLSKDRVLKFEVFEKLVDFMPPADKDVPGYADDLFANLFQ